MRDFATLRARGVKFYGEPKKMPYGTEMVFSAGCRLVAARSFGEDLYGKIFDLIQMP